MHNNHHPQSNMAKKPLSKKKISPILASIFVGLLVIAGIVIVFVSRAADSPYVPSGYVLKWSDEFDGTSVDTTKWNIGNNSTYGDGNNEIQCYLSGNVKQTGGNLVLTGTKLASPISCAGVSKEYSSGRVATDTRAGGSKQTFAFTQGYIEARAKAPQGNIFWPAFWLQGAQGAPGWPAYGEFDISELYPACENMTTGTLHYDSDGNPTNGSAGHIQTSPDVYNVANYTANNKGGCTAGLGAINNDFHIYALEWTTNRLTWLIDGRVMFYFDGTDNNMKWVENGVTQKKPFIAPTTDFWNIAHTITVNLAMGGTGPTYYGWSPTNTKGPTTGDYVIDYVRVYQKSTDQTAPSTPTSLSASYNQTNSSALLSWNASTDNVGVTGYEVWRSVGTGTFSKVADTTTNSYTNTGLSASTSYNYYVKAKDAAGNVSAQSNTATLTTPTPDTPPTAKIDTPTDGLAVFSTTQINATASDDKGITKVEYYVDGISIGTSASSSSPYTISWDTTKYLNGSHSVYVRVTDTAGQSTVSSTVNPIVQNPDTQAPTTPANLTAIAPAYNQVNLTWTASTDNNGVNVYYVVRDGATIAQISGSATSYSDTTVVGSSQYSYYVIAQDAAGNTSANSNSAIVTTPAVPDTTPPTAPTNLSAQVASSTQINLNWSASTDNIAVASYDVYRGSSKIANITSTSFGDVGLSPGSSYTYYVVAIDPSSNRSANSNPASATIPAQVTTGTLNGQVTKSTNGTAIGQAYVTILDNLGNKLYQTRTNSSGFYSIPSIKQGSYSVRFTKNKFNDLTFLQNIQAGIVQILNAIMVPK